MVLNSFYLLQQINIAEVYLIAPYLWDSIIFLMLFLGVTQYVFKRENGPYGKKNGKVVAIAVSIALTVSLVVAEYMAGWYIGRADLAILPLSIMFIVFMYLFYQLLSDMFDWEKRCAMALSYTINYLAFRSMFENQFSIIEARLELLALALFLLQIAMIVMLIICVIGIFKREGNDDESDNSSDRNPRLPRIGVIISNPHNNEQFNFRDPINIEATISGGDPSRHTWIAEYTIRRIPTRYKRIDAGTGSDVRCSFTPPRMGLYKIRVRAYDGNTRGKAVVKISVGGAVIPQDLIDLLNDLERAINNLIEHIRRWAGYGNGVLNNISGGNINLAIQAMGEFIKEGKNIQQVHNVITGLYNQITSHPHARLQTSNFAIRLSNLTVRFYTWERYMTDYWNTFQQRFNMNQPPINMPQQP